MKNKQPAPRRSIMGTPRMVNAWLYLMQRYRDRFSSNDFFVNIVLILIFYIVVIGIIGTISTVILSILYAFFSGTIDGIYEFAKIIWQEMGRVFGYTLRMVVLFAFICALIYVFAVFGIPYIVKIRDAVIGK